MNILIAYSIKPFTHTRYEKIVQLLQVKLQSFGYKIQILRLPLIGEKGIELQKEVLAFNLLKIDNVDLLITLNSPACYLSHTKHIIWLTEEVSPIHVNLLRQARLIFCSNRKIQNQLISQKIERPIKLALPKTKKGWIELNKRISKI